MKTLKEEIAGMTRLAERPELVRQSLWRKNPGDLFLLAAVQLLEEAKRKEAKSLTYLDRMNEKQNPKALRILRNFAQLKNFNGEAPDYVRMLEWLAAEFLERLTLDEAAKAFEEIYIASW